MGRSDRSRRLPGVRAGNGERRRSSPWRLALIAISIVAACTTQAVDHPTASSLGSSVPAPAASPAPSPSSAVADPSSGPTSSRPWIVVASTLALRLPSPLSRAVAFTEDGSALVAGGLNDAGTVATILRITLPDGPITVVGQLAAPVHDAGGALLRTMPLVLGGGRLVPETVVQDLTATVGQLPAPRADLAAVEANGEVIMVGGGTPTSLDRAVLATTDGIHFARVATLLVGVRYPAVAVAGGSIVVVGGTDGTSDQSEIQAIDPAAGTVRLIGRLPHGLSHAAAVVIGGHLLVAGGMTGGHAQDAIWSIDPVTGTATVVGHLPQAVSDAAAVVVNDVAYLLGGEASVRLATIIAIRPG